MSLIFFALFFSFIHQILIYWLFIVLLAAVGDRGVDIGRQPIDVRLWRLSIVQLGIAFCNVLCTVLSEAVHGIVARQ